MAGRAQPKRPVFGWDSLHGGGTSLPAVDDLPFQLPTSSGRAALYQAMLALGLGEGSVVLAPSYHCPTLVAPLRAAGCAVRFYPLDASGLPKLASITNLTGVRAIVVAQLFGLPQSLHEVRAWCDAHRVRLIEDCAHSFFGLAGDRPVGAWGDLATASLTKFFPLSEAGLLASHLPLPRLELPPAGVKQQLKGLIDVVQLALAHRRRPGLPAQRVATEHQAATPAHQAHEAHELPESAWMADCDLARMDRAPSLVARGLWHHLPRGRIVERRRAHFTRLHQLCSGRPGMRPLFGLGDAAAPYVMPLWVDDPEPLYARLRAAGCAVFRWDRVWPGVPDMPGDEGARWQRHVLQLLCHQDLTEAELRDTASLL